MAATADEVTRILDIACNYLPPQTVAALLWRARTEVGDKSDNTSLRETLRALHEAAQERAQGETPGQAARRGFYGT